jgi:anti-sigma factor ChrR (cupin superfamily)
MPTTEQTAARIVVAPDFGVWRNAEDSGVQRKILVGGNGHAEGTAMFERFAPGARRAASDDPRCTEILVLEGSYADEAGRYPAGTYLRNPPRFADAGSSDEGCLLFVRRGAGVDADLARVVVDTASAAWRPGLVAGLTVLPLHAHGTEHVALVDWQPGTFFQPHSHFGGEEILVLAGEFADEHGKYPAGTWISSPHLSRHTPFSTKGCRILVKTGHLATTAATRVG